MLASQQYSYDRSVKSDVSDELINVYLIRPLAGLVVRAVYATPITPNFLTISATAVGVGAALLYTRGTFIATVAAGLCLLMKDVLDSADGQLARAQDLYSRTGRFLDSIGDFVVNLLVFGAIGYVLSQSFGPSAVLLALACFWGTTLRVSYHVFYHASYLHLHRAYETNRIIEEVREEDRRGNAITLTLQRIFQGIYGWQDRLMVCIDGWCRRDKTLSDADWFANKIGLRLSGLIGLGSELFLLTLCSLINQLALYLYFNLIVMNGIALASIWYRKKNLGKRNPAIAGGGSAT